MLFFKKEIKGYLRYLDLIDWWKNLSEEYKKTIINNLPKKSEGMGLLSVSSLMRDEISSSSVSKIQLLSALITTCFKYPKQKELINNMINSIENMEFDSSDIIYLHFLYLNMIGIIYKYRDKHKFALEECIDICEKSISISEKVKKEMLKEYPQSHLPSHPGFKQYAIILEKRGLYQEAINVSETAEKQGWLGDDWSKRILRLKQKI